MKCLRALLLLPLALLLGSCPGAPKPVVYDLAARARVGERWSHRPVVLFGTPAAEPLQADGFYREALGASPEGFVWARSEAELALQFESVRPRAALFELAPFHGVKGQTADVLLNDAPVSHLTLNDLRHRYRVDLPAAAQRRGENRVRFRFAAAASPADGDPASADHRQLAAAFYSLEVGDADDAGLDDLLGRDAPRPFARGGDEGVPTLSLVGPSLVRFAIRVPAAAELRFTPELHPASRRSAGAASFRVTWQAPGEAEKTLWSRVLSARDPPPQEVVLRLPGAEGEIARVGLSVGTGLAALGDRFAWGVFKAPRILGRGGPGPLAPAPLSESDNARGDELRKAVAGANVLFVILDAGRASSFGTYGYGRDTTPEIDRIGREGVVFESAYTPAVYTLGAMSSIWTSQYPDRHHSEVSFSARLPRNRLTLTEVLTARGVHTAGFVANAVAGAGFGFDRGFSEFHEVFRDLGSRGDVFRVVLPGWLEKNKERRFFAYVHFREPHFPYDPEPPFDTKFGPDGPIPKAARRDQGWITDVNQGRRALSADERAHLERLFDGNLAFADREVGALRRALEASGLWDNTVVMVAADHGEQLFEHGWIGHNVQLYEESTRVPLLIRFPAGRGPAGKKVAGLVDLLDVAPTVADIFGHLGEGGSDHEFQGRSLLPVIAGAPGKPATLSRTVWDRPRYALRDERYKFFYDTRTGEEALYDEKTEGEGRDRAAAEPIRTAYYREALFSFMVDAGRARRGGEEEARLTAEQCENLRALGYSAAECK
jgi:arylsulfatase A-like enzyme